MKNRYITLLLSVIALAVIACSCDDQEEPRTNNLYESNVSPLPPEKWNQPDIPDMEVIWNSDGLRWTEIAAEHVDSYDFNMASGDLHEFDYSKVKWVKTYELRKEEFNGKIYQRAYLNGEPTVFRVRPEGKVLYGYDESTDSEFVMYDFNQKLVAGATFKYTLYAYDALFATYRTKVFHVTLSYHVHGAATDFLYAFVSPIGMKTMRYPAGNNCCVTDCIGVTMSDHGLLSQDEKTFVCVTGMKSNDLLVYLGLGL